MKRRNVLGAMAATLVALPLASQAQPAGGVYRIGFLGAASASGPVSARRVEAFRKGLREFGYIEGKNVIVDFRWAEGDADRLPELARELIRLRVDVAGNARDDGNARRQGGNVDDPDRDASGR